MTLRRDRVPFQLALALALIISQANCKRDLPRPAKLIEIIRACLPRGEIQRARDNGRVARSRENLPRHRSNVYLLITYLLASSINY